MVSTFFFIEGTGRLKEFVYLCNFYMQCVAYMYAEKVVLLMDLRCRFALHMYRKEYIWIWMGWRWQR